MNNRSFTLIELLVVIVIIGILAGVIMISTSSSIDKANIAKIKVFEESVSNNLAANMVSRWKLDGNFNDSWGTSNGTNYNVTFLNESQCISDQCGSFNGTSSYIDCGNSSGLNFGFNSFTISIWIKKTAKATIFEGILTKGFLEAYGIYGKTHLDDKVGLYIQSGASSNDINISSYYNKWIHLLWTVDNINDTQKSYLNGVFNNTTNHPVGNITSPYSLNIGRYTSSSNQYFNGSLDDIKIYDAVLSSSQVKQNHVAGLNSLLSSGNISREDYNQRISSLSEK